MTPEILITQPFIAIRRDLGGDNFTKNMGEYLCNPLDVDLLDVEFSTGGFFSDDFLGVVEARETGKRATRVRAGTGARFMLATLDEYYETSCHWSVRYRTTADAVVKISFSASKWLLNCKEYDELLVIGGRGNVVPRCSD